MIQIIKQAAIDAVDQSSPMTITYGTVTKINPLEIMTDQKTPLFSEVLALTSNVINRKAKISFDNPAIKNIVKNYSIDDEAGGNYKLSFQEKVKNEVTIYDGLKVGEKVILLRVNGGQKYIVLDRLVSE